MKINPTFFLLGAILPLVSCASPPIVLAPVGPRPFVGRTSPVGMGHLQVFSSLTGQSDDQNQGGTEPVWYQHTDYSIYNLQGRLVKRVGNTTGHYEQAARRVALAVGRYLVKAQAKDYFQVEVPVTIEGGRTTRVHLDDNWRLQAGTPKAELVTAPTGYPVGWRPNPLVNGPKG